MRKLTEQQKTWKLKHGHTLYRCETCGSETSSQWVSGKLALIWCSGCGRDTTHTRIGAGQ